MGWVKFKLSHSNGISVITSQGAGSELELNWNWKAYELNWIGIEHLLFLNELNWIGID